jgi:hypothetical protein
MNKSITYRLFEFYHLSISHKFSKLVRRIDKVKLIPCLCQVNQVKICQVCVDIDGVGGGCMQREKHRG